jgi:uncharacterized protein YqjF (DUF2071 family)
VSVDAPELPLPVIMRQSWCDLASAHWAVDPAVVAPLLPRGTVPDLLDGRTFVGLLPFRMVGAGLPLGPPVPWLGSFLETNVRLYSVDATGRRGVVFRSLDTDRLAVVGGARAVFGLPYRWARMRHRTRSAAQGIEHEYELRVRRPGRAVRTSRMVVRDMGPMPGGGSELARFVSARWGLHVRRWGRTWYIPNDHEPWPLHRAELMALDDDLVAAAGFDGVADREPDQVLFSPGVRVRFGRPVDADTPRRV